MLDLGVNCQIALIITHFIVQRLFYPVDDQVIQEMRTAEKTVRILTCGLGNYTTPGGQLKSGFLLELTRRYLSWGNSSTKRRHQYISNKQSNFLLPNKYRVTKRKKEKKKTTKWEKICCNNWVPLFFCLFYIRFCVWCFFLAWEITMKAILFNVPNLTRNIW